jgi:hypothetical protein
MERESFEDEGIARTLNEHFVSIKVDREERPDLDQIYMNAIQMITGRGGWPMSVFLTPDLKPFFGGTYWPPKSRMGMPGFDYVLAKVADAWKNRRQQAVEQAEGLTRNLRQIGQVPGSAQEPHVDLLWAAEVDLTRSSDPVNGGFDDAPKFPHPMALQVLMRVWRRRPKSQLLDLVRLHLDKMARGGIYDHLAGGFARYSTDAHWLVPHFEKMLYDNALLADAYLDGYLITGSAEYARVAKETLDYVLNYKTDPQGGFHSTEDADSEGEEGKFYLWTPDEIERVLGREAAERFCYVYDVTAVGNFEGKNILNLTKTVEQCSRVKGWDQRELEAELGNWRAKLLKERDKRVRPAKDDKILVSWNGLMIHTMARAAGILEDEKYLAAATKAAEFLLGNLRQENGRLLHTWRNGQAKFDAYLDDYAFLANAFVSLYEASFYERWIDEAVQLAEIMLDHFREPDDQGFFYTCDDQEALIARSKDIMDNATPSGNAVAATALLRLGKLCGNAAYLEAAEGVLRLGTGLMKRSAIASAQLLIALDMYLGPAPEIVVLGDKEKPETAVVLSDLRARFMPNRVVACRPSADVGESSNLAQVFAGKTKQDGAPTIFVCENSSCDAPVVGRDAALETWEKLENLHSLA